MIYQSQILLRTITTPVTMSRHNAEFVSKIFSDEKIGSDHTIRIDRFAFRKGEIRSIQVFPDLQENTQEKDTQSFYKQESDRRQTLLKLSPKARAQITDMFAYMFKFAVGEFPNEENLRQARATQEQFFVLNPKRTICDANRLLPLIPKIKGRKVSDYEQAYFNVIERAIMRDMQLSR